MRFLHHSLLCLPLTLITLSGACLAQSNAGVGRKIGNQDPLITNSLRQSVAKGLEWLASQQHPRGYWAQDVGFKLNSSYRATKKDAPHVGVTALALMSFLAGGHMPNRGRYGENLNRGLDYVLSCVQENGYIEDNGSRMYSHAFATLFLAEIYGMTQRRDVRKALQKATTVIVDSQNAEGGWRYQLFARESDMSITVCQVMALRSARNVGITVPISTIRAAERYVRESAVVNANRPGRRGFSNHSFGIPNEGGAFRYQLRSHSRATVPLTAAGVTTLYAAGSYDSDLVPPALEYLRKQMPLFNSAFGHSGHYFYYYGHYYAVQAFFITGGSQWTLYFTSVRDQLLSNQQADGSWPCDPGPGKAFSTAVATLVLQIPFQYLPIFQR